MEKREKTDFILEQMRLCLLKRDYVRANIISKKINIRYFKESDVQVWEWPIRTFYFVFVFTGTYCWRTTKC